MRWAHGLCMWPSSLLISHGPWCSLPFLKNKQAWHWENEWGSHPWALHSVHQMPQRLFSHDFDPPIVGCSMGIYSHLTVISWEITLPETLHPAKGIIKARVWSGPFLGKCTCNCEWVISTRKKWREPKENCVIPSASVDLKKKKR